MIPKKFVNLHVHTTFSIGDGIGTPKEYIDSVMSRGMDALAITDHGNMMAFAQQLVYTNKLKKSGKNFRSIFGSEFYFLHSLKDWRELKEKIKAETKATAEDKLEIDSEATSKESEVDGGTVIENEEESRKKTKDPIKQRYHLVLLAKNEDGLKGLFNLTSFGAVEGFYLYPRIDLEAIKKFSKGNIIGTSACIAGPLARIIQNNQVKELDWKDYGPSQDNFELIQEKLKEAISEFQDVFGMNNFYLEIQMNAIPFQHLVNQHLIEASKRTGAKLIVTCDAHYPNPDHWREREVYKLLGWQQKGLEADFDSIPKTKEELKYELYPKNAEQVWESYQRYAKNRFPDVYTDEVDNLIFEAVERTHDIAFKQISEINPDRKVKLPSIEKLISSEEFSSLSKEQLENEDAVAFEKLKELAKHGMKLRKKTSKVHLERMIEELGVVKHLGLAKYFLTYHKIMELCSEEMLSGIGRGSAGSSFLAYCLNITQLDPVEHNLLFARFLSKKKAGLADIDSDFSDRDQAVKAIARYFGEENVIPVSNIALMKPVSLMKDLARLYSVPFEEVNTHTIKMLPEVLSVKKSEPGFDYQQWELTLEELEKHSPSYNSFMEKMELYPDYKKTLSVLFKQVKTLSRHAGGVILTNNALENMPLVKAKGGLQTPWAEGLSGRYLEDLGFLKFDILGIGTLRMFENCIRRILQRHKGIKYPTFKQIKEFFYLNVHPDNNRMNDQKVFKHVFWEGNYFNIFQFVQKNTQTFMSQMKPTSVLDIAIATSIYRPGPLAIKVNELYLNNLKHPENIQYKHPLLKEVLGETAGLIVFQEQLQLIYHKLAGIPLDETDLIRKAFTKKDLSNKEKSEKDREKLREDFRELCLKNNNIDPSVSYSIFDEMEKFVSYSFNKSHALTYATTSYICSWFLTYYPDEWIAAGLDYCSQDKGKASGKEDPQVVAMAEARKLGFTFSKPDINKSAFGFELDSSNAKVIIPGFASLKHVGKSALWEIDKFRPYTRLEDLLINSDGTWRHSKFNKRSLSTLIKLEALESLGLVGEGKTFRNYKEMHNILVDEYDQLKRISARKKNNNVLEALNKMIEDSRNKDCPDWSQEEKVAFCSELSGTVDIDLLISKETRERLEKLKIDSLDQYPYSEDEYQKQPASPHWAIIKNASLVNSKSGASTYLMIKAFAESGEEYRINIWRWNEAINHLKPNAVISAVFTYDKKYDSFTCPRGTLCLISGD